MTVHDLIRKLQAAKIFFTMTTVREDAVMFLITVPGERWEVEVCPDERLEIEVFRGSGGVQEAAKLHELFERFSD
jgi:hypothetical protein